MTDTEVLKLIAKKKRKRMTFILVEADGTKHTFVTQKEMADFLGISYANINEKLVPLKNKENYIIIQDCKITMKTEIVYARPKKSMILKVMFDEIDATGSDKLKKLKDIYTQVLKVV